MSELTKEDKLQIMKYVSEITASTSQQSRLSWNVEALDALVIRLYGSMTRLIKEDSDVEAGIRNE
jgi:hypothetical protein